MRRVHVALLALVLALGILMMPTPAQAAVGDTFTEPIAIGNEQVDCTFKVTSASTVSVGEGGFEVRNKDSYSNYYVDSANPALKRLQTILDSDYYDLDGSGALVIPATITHNGVTYTVTSIASGAFHNGVGIISVTIPDTVTSIGDGAFCGCTALTTVNIPAGVTSIPDCCFSECMALRGIEGAANVTSIGDSAFRTCTAMRSVTIPPKVTSIGAAAYLGCDALIDITMGNAVTSVGAYVFSCNDALETVTLSTSLTELSENMFMWDYNLSTVNNTSQVTSMGKQVFYQCTNLSSFTIPSGLKAIPVEGFYQTGLTSITIPNGVELIDEYAFRYCHQLQSVTFPTSGSCKIGYMAFADCTALETLDLSHVSELVTPYYTWGSQFSGCTGLTSVNLGNLITSIPEDVFYNCRALTSVTFPSQVTSLDENSFGNCTGLNSVTIPATLTTLDYESFKGCYGLVALVLEGDAVKTLNAAWDPSYDYQFTQGFCHIYVPDSLVSAYKADTNWSPVADYILPMSQKPSDTNIYALLKNDGTLVQCDKNGNALSGGKTFVVSGNASSDYAKYAITSIKFQSGVTSVPLGAFAYCKALGSVSLPSGVTSIGENAFYNCTALKSVGGSGVKTVEYRAFDTCPALRSVGFMDRITTLDRYSFQNCTALQTVNLNDSLSEIGDGAFRGCSNLSQVHLPTSATYFIIGSEAFSGCGALKTVNLPSQVAQIGDNAFYNSGLTSVEAPGVLFSMGTGVFRGCKHLTSASGGYIQNSMFMDCTALRSVTIGSDVDEIYGSAFSGCRALQEVEFPSGLSSIDEYAFHNCSGLWSVELPDRLVDLSAAFHNCTGLTSVYLPGSLEDTSGVRSGNEYYGCFSGCTGIASVTFGDGYAANVGGCMFSGCTALRAIDIPDAVTDVGQQAFSGCFLLRDVHLPASLQVLGGSCFQMNVSLQEIDVPAAGTLMMENYPSGGQFEGCTGLSLVSLPEGMVNVAPGMFYHCDSLTQITIPSTVESVEQMAFRKCSNLETVIFENDCAACEFAPEYETNPYWDETYPLDPEYFIFGECEKLSTVVFREKKPQDGVITFSSNPTFYYTVRYYPLEELTSDRANCIGQITVEAGSDILGTSAPAAANIYDGAWMQANAAEPAITATSLSDSGWALPGLWKGVLFVTQPEGGETPDGNFTLSAEARVREVSGGNATDLSSDVAYAWYGCDAAGTIAGDPVGTGTTLSLTGLPEGKNYFVCVASSAMEGLNRSSANSQVVCVNVKSGRLSVAPSPITYRWPTSASTSGYGPTVTLTNTSGFTIRNVRWASENGYFRYYNTPNGGGIGDLDAGVTTTFTLHPDVPDAEARDYQDTLVITSDNAITLEIPVMLTFFDASGAYADFSYGPKTGLETRGTTIDFGTLPADYTNPQGNYGIQCTLWAESGSVTFTRRTSPAHFTVYNENISQYPTTITNMGSGLKIAPKAGLAPGVYEDTMTYTYTADGKTSTLDITLRVRIGDAGGIEVSPSSCSWGSVQEGYGALDARTITVTNNEDAAITLPGDMGSSLSAFVVSGAAGQSIPAGGSKTFTVAPKVGLDPGTYNETLRIAPSGVGAKTVSLSMTVTEAPRAYVYVTNATYPSSEGAAWDGTLLYGEPTFITDGTMLSAITAALDDISSTYTESGGRITSIDGVADGDAGDGSAWRFYLNGDEVTGSLADVTLDLWDEVWCRYIAGEGSVRSCLLDDIEVESGTMSPAFSSENLSYEVELEEGSQVMYLRVVPRDADCPISVKVGGELVLPDDDDPNLFMMGIEDGDRVTITCGEVDDDEFFEVKNYTIDVTVPVVEHWRRLAGTARYDTMAEIVGEGFDHNDCAVVANGDNFPDALSASSLAGALDCPVVLTSSKTLSPQARAQLERLGVSEVYIMGGTFAVSEAAERQILSIESVTSVKRVAGADRQGTSLATMQKLIELGSSNGTVVVATGLNFADALAIGPWCYATETPILLTGKNKLLSQAQADAAREAGVTRVIVCGGEAAVNRSGVLSQLGLTEDDCVLLAGTTRYDTADEIARFELQEGMGMEHAAVATGANFPDALAGAALCGANESVLVLASGTGSPAVITLLEHGEDVKLGYFLGGTYVVSKPLARYIEEQTR